jgi:alpha-L-rhamnosidase
MKNRLVLLFITLLTVGNSYSQNKDSKSLTILEPRVEYHENPEGIDVLQPRFSWILKGEGRNRAQSAYQITVASSMEKLSQEQVDIWDSG